MVFRIAKFTFCLLILVTLAFLSLFFYNPYIMIDAYVEEDDKTIVAETKHLPINFKLFVDDVSLPSGIEWSFDGKHFAYFDHVNIKWAEKEWALKIVDARFFTSKIIFIGDYHASVFDWIDDSAVRICVSAGSGVRQCRNVDIGVKQPVVAVDNYSSGEWTALRNISK